MSGVKVIDGEKNQKRDQRLRELLVACGLNDQKAFARLYQVAAPKLYGVVLNMLKREAWAEECLQETFVKIWNNADSYRSHLAAPMTWMTAIARNQALDHLRRYRRETLESDGTYITEEIDTDPLPLDRLADSEEGSRLKACLEQLNEKQRQVISLAYFRGLSQSELANQIDMPLGTVKTHIRRGLEELRGCLQ
ncbi:MAG: RNA polymerase subunit sigma [gamma proteobacterium symbiont of Ctena orbiculata]|nr:MAG: RNA polymerase subunit sigma [gamma proteobacterium symbiont of Ctena orbiculata]PVV27080.1 MAG: RNA polymerase subunit sigma [gamma proteobacterium symbiont of Ctena orbiculata]